MRMKKSKIYLLTPIVAFLLLGCNAKKPDTPEVPTYKVSDYYNGYYSSLVSWENSEDLTDKLYTLIRKDYNPISYSDPNWETNKEADQDLYLEDSVNVLYSDIPFLKSATNTGWQREHAFAASLMTGYATGESVSSMGRATDFHNLFAAYATGNTSRGNKNFGVADPNDPGYQGTGTGKGIYGDYKCDTYTFEPSSEDKGKVARSIFYMGVMYSKEETNIDVPVTLTYDAADAIKYGQKSTTVHLNATYGPIRVVEEPSTYSKISYTNWVYETTQDIKDIKSRYSGSDAETYAEYSKDNCSFSIGHLQTLINWNKYNDVDLNEYQHNESVYSHVYSVLGHAQGNRNPFVDYPELVDYVYGNKKDSAGRLEYLRPTQDKLDAKSKEVSHYAIEDIKRSYMVGETLNKTDSYKLIEVAKDLSRKPATFENTNDDYTFKEADIGNVTVRLATPLNTISYDVEVKKATSEETSYRHVLSGYNGDFLGKNTAGVTHTVTLSDVSWDVYWKSGAVKSANSSPSSGGVKWGQSGDAVETLRFESTGSFSYKGLTKIKSIGFEGNTASGCSYNFVIKVNDETVYSNKMTYKSTDPKMSEYEIELSTVKEGKITIEITNITNAIYINALMVTMEQ